MEYSVQQLAKSKIELAVSIDKEEWAAAIQEAYNKNKHKYKIEGFRPGKVPFNVLAKRYGVEIFYDDALDVALNKHYVEILDKEQLDPVAKPELDVKVMDEDGLKVVITFAVAPKFQLGQYKDLTVESKAVVVTDEEVDKEVEAARERAGRLVDVTDRAVEKGDTITLDYSGAVDGKKFEGGTAEKQTLVIGSGMFIPGFEDQLIGATIGQTLDVKVKFPDEYHAEELKGKDAVFTCTVHEIKVKELPAVDDEFAKDVSEFDTLAEYKADLKGKLEERASKEIEYKEETDLIDKIVAATEIDLPDEMIDDELNRMMEELEMRMSYSGLKMEDYLKYAGTTLDAIKAERREEAVRSLKSRLVIEEIIKTEKLYATMDEVDAELKKMAEDAGKDFEEYKKEAAKGQQMLSLMNKITIDKLFAFLRANNKIDRK